jgi:hypothetical protein
MIYQNEYRIDFIGIGTGKSGTTWLSEVLSKNPDVYISPERKEINYFNKYLAQDYKTPNWEYKKSYDWYHAFFKNAAPNQKAGDITPCYMSMENCAEDIYKYNREIKLFTILRHPVERSFSEFLFSKQNGINIYKDFETAIEKNPSKFINTSMYYQNLLRFYDRFPKENIKLLFYEDLKKDKKNFLKSVYDFLEVQEFYFEGFDKIVNAGQSARIQGLNNFIGKSKMLLHSKNLQFILPIIQKLRIVKGVQKIKELNLTSRKDSDRLSDDTRKKLLSIFSKDVETLEKISGKDLSAWKV